MRTSARLRTRALALAVAVASLAACGTRVTGEPVATDSLGALPTAGPGAPLVDGGPATPPTGGDAPALQPGDSTGPPPAAGDGGAPAPVGSGGSAAPRPGGRAAPPTAGRSGPGVTDTTIKFGVAYSTDTGAGNAALGGGGTDPGDARNYFNALVEEVNASGGVAGRKLVPSYFEARATSGESVASQEQAACEKWTRDDRVFVVFGTNSENSRGCAQDRGLLAFHSGASNSLPRTFARYPHYIEISSIALDRHLRATVDGLAQTDYYGKAPVIGVVTWDDRDYREGVQRTMVPALARLGHAVKEQAYIAVPQTLEGVGDSSAAVNNAVLRFRQAGVTHVFVVDGPAGVFVGTGLTFLFIRSASSQRYYPRYGMNDSNSPQAGMDAGFWGPEDVPGSRAVSWANVLEPSDAGITPNASRKECLALMKRHGMVPGNVNARATMIRACDFVWFLRAVLGTQRLPVVTRDLFVSRAAALGSTYRSPAAYRTFFSRTQRDGVAGLRRMALDDGCGCYRYTSGIYAAPTR